MQIKITLTISIALLLSISLLYGINDYTRDFYDISRLEDEWYTQKFDPNMQKITMLGASHVAGLNSTHIMRNLSENGYDNYELYNLSKPVDFIEKRIPHLDNLISIKPDLVVIGIRFQDFSTFRPAVYESDMIINLNPFLNSTEITQQNFKLLQDQEFSIIDPFNFKNPKLTTFYLMSWIVNGNPEPPHVFWKAHTKSTSWPQNVNEIYNMETDDFPHKNTRVFVGEIDENGRGVLALKYILTKLQENKIDVVIFTTPHYKTYRNAMDLHDVQKFEVILNEIKHEFDINIEFLHDDYSDMMIWNNYDHIARNSESLIYSEDVSKIILQELNS